MIRHRLRALLLRRRMEREMRTEMAAHIERSVERLRARGLTQAEAEREAHREFGNIVYLQELARDARGSRWLESIAQDLRYAVRQFARTPLLSVTMILVLSIGLGGSTALFTVLHSLTNRPGPGIPPNDALVRIRGLAQLSNGRLSVREGFSLPELEAYAAHEDVLTDVAAWRRTEVAMDAGAAGPDLFPATAHYVTPNYFRVLGVRPALGDVSLVDDPSQTPVAVISDAMWRIRFGGASDVIGRQVRVNDVVVTIGGVAPSRFEGANANRRLPDVLWLPLSALVTVQGSGLAVLTSPDSADFDAAALLAPGVDPRIATARLSAVAASAIRDDGDAQGRTSDIVPLRPHNETLNNQLLINGIAFAVICLLVLLIVCTNVSGLQLGLALTRRREIAVRLSLGAARRRVVRQLVTESVLLACSAALLAFVILRVLLSLFGHYVPDVTLVLDLPPLLFAFALAAITGIAFGISPALHATRFSVADVLKDSAAVIAGPRSRLQNGLVIAQVALTQPLLVGLGVMMVLAVQHGREIRWQVPEEQLVWVGFASGVRNRTYEEALAEFDRVADRIRALPGVVAAVPHGRGEGRRELGVHPADRPAHLGVEPLPVAARFAAPGFLQLAGIPLLRGREFTPADSGFNGGIIIGDDVARELWGTLDVIGRRFTARGPRGDTVAIPIRGVVSAQHIGASTAGERINVFMPNFLTTGALLVRTVGTGASLIPSIRRAAHEVAPQLPIQRIETIADDMARERRYLLQMTTLVAAGGMLALLLSAIGLFAIVSRGVAHRVREIGIRTALGASTSQVVRLFVITGLRLGLIGTAIGLPLGLLAFRLVPHEIDVARSVTPLIALAIGILAATVTLIASWLPARRAARFDPLQALRSD